MQIEKKVCYKVDGHLFDTEAGANEYIRVKIIERWLVERLCGTIGNIDNFQDDRITVKTVATVISEGMTDFLNLLTDTRALHGVSDG